MEDNIFDKLQEVTGKLPNKLNILEEQIDVKVQMEYFKLSKKIKKNRSDDSPAEIEDITDINSNDLSDDDIKKILIQLADIDDPKAFRQIEAFAKIAPPNIKDWATLAFQESKMNLESSLLDENQIYISTGLGGKDNKLRYFIVLIGKDIKEFAEYQQKVVKSEFEYTLKNNGCELETIDFYENYATFTTLIPVNITFQDILRSALMECNQYGDFLQENFMVTNVKKLTIKEIKDFVEKNKHPDKNSSGLDFKEIDESGNFINGIDDILGDDDENNNNEIDESDDE